MFLTTWEVLQRSCRRARSSLVLIPVLAPAWAARETQSRRPDGMFITRRGLPSVKTRVYDRVSGPGLVRPTQRTYSCLVVCKSYLVDKGRPYQVGQMFDYQPPLHGVEVQYLGSLACKALLYV